MWHWYWVCIVRSWYCPKFPQSRAENPDPEFDQSCPETNRSLFLSQPFGLRKISQLPWSLAWLPKYLVDFSPNSGPIFYLRLSPKRKRCYLPKQSQVLPFSVTFVATSGQTTNLILQNLNMGLFLLYMTWTRSGIIKLQVLLKPVYENISFHRQRAQSTMYVVVFGWICSLWNLFFVRCIQAS